MHYMVAARRFGAFTARFGTAAGFIAAANWVFDYPFTAWVIWALGSLLGGAFILLISPVLNYAVVLWYRKTTSDWFGLEWLRAQEAIQSDTWSGKTIRALLKKSRILAFVAIAVLLDPVYAFIYQRGRTTGVRLTPHDWWWFALANAIGILPWVIGASIAIETAKITIH